MSDTATPSPVLKRRRPVAVWLLGLVTLGIYTLVWYYRIHVQLRTITPDRDVNPTGSLLTLMFGGILLGIPPLVSIVNTGSRIRAAQRQVGLTPSASGGLGLLLALLFGVYVCYYQAALNRVIAQHEAV